MTKARPSIHMTYRRTAGGTGAPLSKTERKVLESIPEDGMGVADIANAVGISVRRTFKVLEKTQGERACVEYPQCYPPFAHRRGSKAGRDVAPNTRLHAIRKSRSYPF